MYPLYVIICLHTKHIFTMPTCFCIVSITVHVWLPYCFFRGGLPCRCTHPSLPRGVDLRTLICDRAMDGARNHVVVWLELARTPTVAILSPQVYANVRMRITSIGNDRSDCEDDSAHRAVQADNLEARFRSMIDKVSSLELTKRECDPFEQLEDIVIAEVGTGAALAAFNALAEQIPVEEHPAPPAEGSFNCYGSEGPFSSTRWADVEDSDIESEMTPRSNFVFDLSSPHNLFYDVASLYMDMWMCTVSVDEFFNRYELFTDRQQRWFFILVQSGGFNLYGSEGPFRLRTALIKLVNSSKIFHVQYRTKDIIAFLHLRIQQKRGVPREDQRLIGPSGRQLLARQKKISDVANNNATFRLVYRLRVSVPRKSCG